MKKLVTLLLFLTFSCFGIVNVHAAYLRDIPVTVTQPDGTVLHCFASGDEFFNYLHDSNGYTIIQHPRTGYYVYAEIRDGNLVPTEFVANRQDPTSNGLRPYALITPEEWKARRRAWEVPEAPAHNRDNTNHGTLNNISIFIRFSDDGEFTNTFSSIDNMFNDVSEGAVSMRSYFRAASYGAIEIPTTFYPGHNGETIISYQDIYPRSYFQPYNWITNPNGYLDENRAEREFALLDRAVKYVNANYPVPADLDIDYDNNGLVDNVCFIVRGDVGDWSSLLWPHQWTLYGRDVTINEKRVWTFNFQLADAYGYFNTPTMCHEMNHSLGAPDLYHYSYSGPTPVGVWDLMESDVMPPQHCGAYMKMRYGHWIDEIPEITQAGVYTLNPISSSSPTNIAYKIQSDDPNQFYVLEYRDNTSLFESGLPGSGLLVYRIDTRFSGNASYNPSTGIYDEIYIFRPGGSSSVNGNLYSAYFSSDVGRTEFSASTSAYPFLTDGTIDNNLKIYNITNAGSTISFTYGSSSVCGPPTHLIASVENNNVTLSWNAAANASSYNIYRGGTLIGNTTGTTYVDSNPGMGRHLYFLKSVDANGLLSTPSETVIVNMASDGYIIIGDGGSATNDLLPSYSYFNYSFTQQIYTADEIGAAGLITEIAFFNSGTKKNRNYDFYLKSTTKDAFFDSTDWEVVTDADKVFSGLVTMTENDWTVIFLDTPFEYDGVSNLVLVSDDNSGVWSYAPHMSCRVFNAPNQALLIYSDDINYNPDHPTSYNGALFSVKNQIALKVEDISPSATYFIRAGTWSNVSNWKNSLLPGADDVVYIDAPCQLDQDATVAELYVSDGQSLTLQSGKTLTVTGTLDNTAPVSLVIKEGAQLINASANVAAMLEKKITSYGREGSSHWYAIASPMNEMFIMGSDFLTPSYDLYRFNETNLTNEEWENRKDDHREFNTFENGRGYLYANSNDFTPSFTGILNVSAVTRSLTCTNRLNDPLSGFNLIGNPFPHNIYKGAGAAIDNANLASGYYTLTNEGTWQVHTFEDAILPGQGILVKAIAPTVLTIAKSNLAASSESSEHERCKGSMSISVEGDNGQDQTFVYFGEGISLEKRNGFNAQAPSLWICDNGKDYAIAHVDNVGESLEIYFSSKQVGDFKLTIDRNEMVFEYLQLVDHVTGLTVDLLKQSTYGFHATGLEPDARFSIRFKVAE